ncbi:hypothetical protein TNCV_1362551 [Trichonephila clavipes]|nr:hypothetical protein TNCV_1362551 [Trichonephila clavipes]
MSMGRAYTSRASGSGLSPSVASTSTEQGISCLEELALFLCRHLGTVALAYTCVLPPKDSVTCEENLEAGRRFQSVDEVKSASQAELKDMAKNGFQKCFDDRYKR